MNEEARTPDMQVCHDILVEAIKSGSHPLPDAASMAVPLEIDRLLEQGGPNQGDWEFIAQWADALAERGDVLLYGGKPGEAAKLFGELVRTIAVMAFVPGGVSIFGHHYQAKVRIGSGNAKEMQQVPDA